VIGRVFVNRVKDGNDKDSFQVFSTVCPHLGCSINSSSSAPAGEHPVAFICPCHNGQFLINGERRPNDAAYTNPSPRGMYALEFELDRDPSNLDENNRDLLKVKYVLPTSAPADAPHDKV
jgi:Rieske Fe-S protein